MRKLAPILFSVGALALVSGCDTTGGGGYFGFGGGPADVYYDGYYGPYAGGYWGPDMAFYYRDRGGHFMRDDAGHFHRQAFAGGRGFHSGRSPRG
jgi:hypothetical protein